MRIEQNSTFLLDLVRGTGKGQYGLAPFQRQYVWNRDDVEKLLRSIMRRWPIGSFTLWSPVRAEREFFSTRGRIGPVEHAPDVETLILDGQNRLASLVYATLVQTAPASPAHPYSQEELDVWFGDDILVADFGERAIRFMPSAQAWSATKMPFGMIMDATVFNRIRQWDVFSRAQELGVADEALNWFMDEIPAMVREARVTATHLIGATLEEARECYMTICRAGQPISDEEFDLAFNYRQTPASPAISGPPRFPGVQP